MVEAGFASDDQLITFPAGLCSRRRNGVIRDLDWKKTFIVKSVEAHRDVVPFILTAVTPIFSITWRIFAKRWVSSLI